MLLKGVLRGKKVPEVDWVEAAAKEAYFHVEARKPAGSQGPGQGQTPASAGL
jgi:hypothetical protein